MFKRQLLYGLATFVPGVTWLAGRGAGSTASARYCYSVWLRHLVVAGGNGFSTAPGTVAELGPGSSLGIGLAALLSGAERYLAFDVVAHATAAQNLAVLDELVELFGRRAAIPDAQELPEVLPRLDDYSFPRQLLPDARLATALLPGRVEGIRASLRDTTAPSSVVQYRAPWSAAAVLERESVDMILSQAVLEHVDHLRETYRAMHAWLRPGGFMSHQVDFRCHNTAVAWNGHLAYQDWLWKLMRGRRPYLINREPFSAHLRLAREAGFAEPRTRTSQAPSGIARGKLAHRYRDLPDGDLGTDSALIQAQRP
jgi:SAM-dependent methyltransferase